MLPSTRRRCSAHGRASRSRRTRDQSRYVGSLHLPRGWPAATATIADASVALPGPAAPSHELDARFLDVDHCCLARARQRDWRHECRYSPRGIPGSTFSRVLPPKCVKLLASVAQELSTGFQPLDSHDLGFAWWLASAWNAYEHGDTQDVGSLHSAVARAMALLREDSSKNLKALATETRISPSQLSRLFKRQAGVSITDFRNGLRLESFVKRSDGGRSDAMFALAKEAGFGSYAQFSRVFRRQMGCSPETYYRNLRHNKQPSLPAAEKAVLVPSVRSPR